MYKKEIRAVGAGDVVDSISFEFSASSTPGKIIFRPSSRAIECAPIGAFPALLEIVEALQFSGAPYGLLKSVALIIARSPVPYPGDLIEIGLLDVLLHFLKATRDWSIAHLSQTIVLFLTTMPLSEENPLVNSNVIRLFLSFFARPIPFVVEDFSVECSIRSSMVLFNFAR
jgi:hypothetical protein